MPLHQTPKSEPLVCIFMSLCIKPWCGWKPSWKNGVLHSPLLKFPSWLWRLLGSTLKRILGTEQNSSELNWIQYYEGKTYSQSICNVDSAYIWLRIYTLNISVPQLVLVQQCKNRTRFHNIKEKST